MIQTLYPNLSYTKLIPINDRDTNSVMSLTLRLFFSSSLFTSNSSRFKIRNFLKSVSIYD